MSERREFGWIDLIIGILFIFLGFTMFSNPGSTLRSLVVLFGVIALTKGIFGFFKFYFFKKITSFWIWFIFLMSAIDFLFGILLVSNVSLGVIGIDILIPTWLLASSITGIIDLWYIKKYTGVSQGLGLVLLVISILTSILMILNPGTASLTLAYMLGLSAISFGFSLVIQAFQ